jgi:chemotaxis receptor (MCP) glutamine deamidase CheD
MQTLSARATENDPKEIKVGTNECRIARQGERLVARAVLADVVVTVQVPSAGFAAMLRFSAPEEAAISSARLQALCDFADQALALIFDSTQSMNIASESMLVSAIGGGDVDDLTHGHGSQLASAVQESLGRHGVVLSGSDLGGTQTRSVWLDSSSGRLIVRSASLPSKASVDSGSAGGVQFKEQPGEISPWLPPVRRNAIA